MSQHSTLPMPLIRRSESKPFKNLKNESRPWEHQSTRWDRVWTKGECDSIGITPTAINVIFSVV